jgi:hypothetical protein
VGAAETRVGLPGERRTNPMSFIHGDVPVHAWRWSPQRGLEDLGTLGGKHSVAWGVDPDGNAYGWAKDANEIQRAVKWTWDGRIVRLPDLGGFAQADPPNQHGILPGQADTPTGAHAVLWVPKKK